MRRERGDGRVRVAVRPGVSYADLGAAFGVAPGTVQSIVDRLEHEGRGWQELQPVESSG